MLLFLLAASALAGIPEDLAAAADTDLPTAVREAALARILASDGSAKLVELADLPDTPRAQRWVAVRALGKMQDDTARAALLRYLEDKDASTRMAALGALGDRGDRTLSGRIAAHLSDKALLVRTAACDALGVLKDPSTLADLDRALSDPSNSYRGTSLWLRRHAVEAMGSIGTDAAVPYLGKALDDPDPDVVTAAKAGLEKIAGFSYAEGRSPAEEILAWKRWSKRL